MQIADEAEVFDMANGEELKEVVNRKKPDIIIPEIEALNVNELELLV